MIHKNLKKFRLDNKFSQLQMAELMNISSPQYSKIENGQCYLNLHHIDALANSLGKKSSEIYTIIDELRGEHIEFGDKEQQVIDVIPHLTVPFELALQRLKAFCIDNNYLISIHPNGDISLELKYAV